MCPLRSSAQVSLKWPLVPLSILLQTLAHAGRNICHHLAVSQLGFVQRNKRSCQGPPACLRICCTARVGCIEIWEHLHACVLGWTGQRSHGMGKSMGWVNQWGANWCFGALFGNWPLLPMAESVHSIFCNDILFIIFSI